MTAPAPRNHPAEDAHPAPTPAPVAVPEGGWRDGDAVVVLNSNGYPFVHERRRDGSWTGLRGAILDAWISQAIEVGGWVLWVHAPREAPRPEPVVAPLPSEAVEALAEVIEPLSKVVARVTARAIAEGVLAAGYRLVPEDDEDTVRVSRSAVERLHPRGTIRVPVFDEFDSPTRDGCTRCHEFWPCDTMRLLGGAR